MRAPPERPCTRRSVLCAGASLALLSCGLDSTLAVPKAAAPTRARVDVRRHGARGDGRHDDTAALQRAIAALPDEGGTVVVPAGNYLIDALRSVHLRGAMRLELDPDARLVAMPNAAERAYVLSAFGVSDLDIVGGQIIGERDRHRGSSGEWGHGLAIRSCKRVHVQGLKVSRCWGDGISIGTERRIGALEPSSDIVLAGVTCQGNRRQGLTIGRAHRVRVLDSAFLDTGGTAPASGIDIEPDSAGGARDIRIERCLIRGNRGSGIELQRQSSDVWISDCRILDNGGYGVLFASAHDCRATGNILSGNAQRGIAVRKLARGIRVERNNFRDNGPAKHVGKHWRHLDIAADAAAVSASDNRFD